MSRTNLMESIQRNLKESEDKKLDKIDKEFFQKEDKFIKNTFGKDSKDYKDYKKQHEDKYGKDYIKEDEATSSKEESFLNKTITVYDIDSFLKDEEQVVSFHYNSGAAILFKDGSDEGCIVDYEAIGEKFTSKDEEVEIEANDIPNDEPGKISIHVMPQYICRTTINEIISKAPHKEMKASEFFTKHNYNMRCSTNFSNMLNYLGVKEESNLKEEDDEWDTYNVAVGFCGFIGVEQEYNISARSKQEAVCEALDNPGSEAEQDLSADVVDDHGDGSYTVTVSFAGNIGAENDYEVTAESAEEAEMLALEDAKSDLEIISVNGEEYTYGDEVESAGMVNESDNLDNLAQDLKSTYPNISEDKINEILTDVERLNETLGISGFFCKGHTTYVEGKEISVRFYTEENDMFILCYGYSAYDWELYFEGIINDKVTEIAKRVRQELNNGR